MIDKGNLLSINAYHYSRGGSDNVYFSHAALLKKNGFSNSFFAMNHPKNLICEDSQYFAEYINYENPSIKEKVVGASRLIYNLEAKTKLSQLLDSRKIDIAHIHNIYHNLSPSIFSVLKKRKIPIVMTVHDLKLACPAYTMTNASGKICERCKGGKIWNVAVHKCIKENVTASSLIMIESAIHKALGLYSRFLDKIITPSKFYRNKLIEWGWPAEKLVHIPNFISDIPTTLSNGVYLGDILPNRQHSNSLLYFGRLAPEKGLVTLIKASKNSGVSIRIAGTGPQEAELRNFVKLINAPVTFLGHLTGKKLLLEIDEAKAIVLPSEWFENAPMSVIEAFQRYRSVIGAKIGGIPELVKEGQTGWLFESGNVIDLTQKMIEVRDITHTGLVKIERNCQQLIKDCFSENIYLKKINEVYEELSYD